MSLKSKSLIVALSGAVVLLIANYASNQGAAPAVAKTPKPVECPDVSQAVLQLDHFIENALDAQGLTFEQPSIFLKSQARGPSLMSRGPCEYRAWSFVDVRNGFGGYTRTVVQRRGALRRRQRLVGRQHRDGELTCISSS